jgi:hypothetical protein
MENNQNKTNKAKLSHFEELNIEILSKQNHNLFQTVNQLKHELNQMSEKSKDSSDRMSKEHVSRVLKFLLFSVALGKPTRNQGSKLISEKTKNHITSIISKVLGSEKNSEKNMEKDIEAFVHDALGLINQISFSGDTPKAQNKIESEGKLISNFAL